MTSSRRKDKGVSRLGASNPLTDFVRRQGEIAAGVAAWWVVASGVYLGVVSLTGGNVVPWATPVDLEAMSLLASAEQSKALVALDNDIRLSVEVGFKALRDSKNTSECEDYNGRLDRAAQALMVDPNNENQRNVYRFAAEKLNRIADCKPIVLPILPTR